MSGNEQEKFVEAKSFVALKKITLYLATDEYAARFHAIVLGRLLWNFEIWHRKNFSPLSG